jgi:hypothetical protein
MFGPELVDVVEEMYKYGQEAQQHVVTCKEPEESEKSEKFLEVGYEPKEF